MLKKSNRIRNNAVLESLLRSGKIYKDPLLVFRYRPLPDGESRFAVSISKKCHKKAVCRNRLKRQIYEAIRRNFHLLKNRMVCLVSARAGLKKPDFRKIEQNIIHFFHHLSPDE